MGFRDAVPAFSVFGFGFKMKGFGLAVGSGLGLWVVGWLVVGIGLWV